MNQSKQLIILIFIVSLTACGRGGSDTAANEVVNDPGNTTPLPGDVVCDYGDSILISRS